MPAGEIPQEIKEQLAKDRKVGGGKAPTESEKSSLAFNLGGEGGGASSSDELPPAVTGEALERLVNENPAIVGDNLPPADPSAELERYKAIVSNQNGDIKSLRQQLAAAKESAKGGAALDDSRKFRIYLALLEGFTARGDYSSESLVKEGGGPALVQKRLEDRIQHAANLVEYAFRAIGKLPEKLRF